MTKSVSKLEYDAENSLWEDVDLRRIPRPEVVCFLSDDCGSGDKKELKNRMRKIVEENKYKRKAKVVLAVIMVTSVVFTFSGCGNVTQKMHKIHRPHRIK